VGAYRSREIEREADGAAMARLAAAGYCVGPVMRVTFAELSRLKPAAGAGGVLASHPGYTERGERAGPGCQGAPES
jgi:predicted Zn-dependent protease